MGKFLGNYEILEKIGEGGMGVVYKVRHRHLHHIYALKTMIPGKHASAETLERFYREAQLVAKLQHPGIVSISDFAKEGDLYYFVMEYVDGEPLNKKISAGLPLREGLILLQKTLGALHYAHQQGIIHRDLKPENIYITKEGEPKLGDFGLAKEQQLTPSQQKLTQSGMILGTPAYMPPEQVLGELDKIDARSDIYAMGVCLYEILTRKLPFEGNSTTQLFYKIVYEDPLPPSRVNSEIHHDLETITLKALEKRKFKRYSSCAVFQEDLKRFLNGSPILAKPITPLDQLKKKIQRHRSKFIVGGLVFLGMSLFFTLALWRSFQKKQKQAQGFYQQAKKVFEEAEKTLSTPPSLQAERLFKALDFIDESLVLQAQNVQAQQLKVEISQKLIAQTCTFKEYHFAGYLLQDLRNRHLISSAQHQAKLQEIQELQAQQKKNNLQRFKEMIEELRTQSLYPWRVEDYIFEISQMKEKEIVEELESLVKEGTTYFLHSKKHLQKSQLYGSAVSALGRVSSNKEVLLEALDQMMKKLIPLAEKKRSISESEYAAKLVHALGNLKSSDSLYLLYRYVKEMGQYSLFSLKSLDALRKLAKEAPIEAPSTAIDYMMKGYQESLRHENEKAFESYHQALERDPQLIEAYLLRGRLYNDHAHFEKSVQDFNTLLSQKLDSPSLLSEVYLNRGYAFQRWGFDLRKSNPNEMEKKFTQAFYDFNQAIQHQKKSEEVYFRRGFFYVMKGEFERALQDYNQAIQLNPHFGWAYTKRGVLKKGQGKIKEAEVDLLNAIEFAPTISESYRSLCEILYEDPTRKAEAIYYIETAILYNPKDVDLYLFSANIQHDLGEYSEAVNDYQKVLELKPEHPEREKILQAIEWLKSKK